MSASTTYTIDKNAAHTSPTGRLALMLGSVPVTHHDLGTATETIVFDRSSHTSVKGYYSTVKGTTIAAPVALSFDENTHEASISTDTTYDHYVILFIEPPPRGTSESASNVTFTLKKKGTEPQQ